MELAQFAVMVEQMRTEKHLLVHTPESLFEQWQSGLTVVRCDGDVILAHVTLWPLIDGVYELGNIWVNRERRSHGLGNRVMGAVLRLREHILLTSTNPIVWRMSEDHHLRLMPFVELPPAIWQATCICSEEKRGSADFRQCKLCNDPCRLYLK